MNEQNEVEQIHKLLLAETNDEVKKYSNRIYKWMILFFIIIGASLGGATAIWNNVGLVTLFGGIIFSTAGALIIALGALPSERTILNMGCTYCGGNKYLVAELRKNKILAQRGIYLIILGHLFFSTDLALRVLS